MQEWEHETFIWWGTATHGYESRPRASDIEQFGDNPKWVVPIFDSKGEAGWELVQIVSEEVGLSGFGEHPDYTTRWTAFFKKPKVVV